MDFEGYKTKIQKASELIEDAKCPEDILNNNKYDLANDFQYICLSSNINSELVNDVIARLAQNGNKKIVEDNIGEISIAMWKDLFNKNNAIKEICINNFTKIIENAGILTYREIENFINDKETITCVYDSFNLIIKKLCTYDRAALIANVKTKENGIEKIKEYIEKFFQKGEFDISTTYSKVLIELNKIPEIGITEILEACSKNLNEMLERETAIDNETNVLLSWIYDSMEETQMYDEQRKILQNRIDESILNNFDCILDKTNYDKETIKILKQFPCTFEKFEGNKNLFIEKSNKLIHMTKIYNLNAETENKEIENNAEEIVEELAKDNLNEKSNNNIIADKKAEAEEVSKIEPAEMEDKEINEIAQEKIETKEISQVEQAEMKDKEINEVTQEKVEIKEISQMEQAEMECKEISETTQEEICQTIQEKIEYNENCKIIEEQIENTKEDSQEVPELEIDISECNNPEQENTVINMEELKENNGALDEIIGEVEALEEYTELIEQSGNSEGISAEAIIDAIVNGNLFEADKIIEKVMQRDKAAEQKENESNVNDNKVTCSNKIVCDNCVEEVKEESLFKNNDESIEKEVQKEDIAEKVEDNQALIINEDNPYVFGKIVNVIKNLVNKIKKIFSKYKTDRIGD